MALSFLPSTLSLRVLWMQSRMIERFGGLQWEKSGPSSHNEPSYSSSLQSLALLFLCGPLEAPHAPCCQTPGGRVWLPSS